LIAVVNGKEMRFSSDIQHSIGTHSVITERFFYDNPSMSSV